MVDFLNAGRLPVPGDNVAIATRRLEAGTTIAYGNGSFVLPHTVLEGHRFAVAPIGKGARLTSWGMPFGTATSDIVPGDYICNPGVLEALAGRRIDFALPEVANFTDEIPPFQFDPSRLASGEPVVPANETLYFDGYDRGDRGAGTRNYVIVLGVSSRTAGFARRLAAHFNHLEEAYGQVDGVVPVAHTEGDDAVQHNRSLVLRTLAGFAVHPNVGAVLSLDHPAAGINNVDLQDYLETNDYPVARDAVRFMTLDGSFAAHFEDAVGQVTELLDVANASRRTRLPASKLKIALQCGGSDAFSGISGNPLAGWVAREVIAQGGAANLAETDELIGAESYVLKNVASAAVAHKFLSTVSRFQERAAMHGSSAAGNPSGGNKFRGLYNIYLKSLGAAMKRDPAVQLDAVIEYGELMDAPGFYFMDSPGNDLESIAGQVAAGCNMIFFVTGNGSITNFPFVPTLKVVTTTARYKQLAADMDVNAGQYLDGVDMDDLGRAMLHTTLTVAGGEQSVGEQAGHAQVQLWRNWRLDAGSATSVADPGAQDFSGIPLAIDVEAAPKIAAGAVTPAGVGLVLPTSLCSGQISELAVAQLNAQGLGAKLGVEQFVSVVHTEGCGASSGSSEMLFLRTMCGHLMHPAVKHALLLEHGCEKTHNDYFRNYLEAEGVDTTRYGWASIQQDGGIEPVIQKITDWFATRPPDAARPDRDGINVGLLVAQSLSEEMAAALANLVAGLVSSGGTVVLPKTLDHGDKAQYPLLDLLGVEATVAPTIQYGQRVLRPGLHAMAVPTWHEQEVLAGLAATGVDVMLVVSDAFAVPAHPFIPVLQLGMRGGIHADWSIEGKASPVDALMHIIQQTVSGAYTPQSMAAQHTDFQISRGWRGISL